MTISSTVRIAGPYIGSGAATVFPFAFKVFAAAEMQVAKLNTTSNVEIILVLNTDYTVQLNGDQNGTPGGTITLPAVLASGFNLTITSDIANLQPTDLTNQGGFYPEVITDALDRATIQIQQLDQNSRAIKIPLSDGVLDMTTPVVAARQGKYLAFDSLGLPVASVGTGNDSALRTDLANATAVSAGSRLSGFRQAGTGATARTVDSKLKDTVSVKDFGAVGDGVADDTVAIQAAIAYAASTINGAAGMEVFLPTGTYLISSRITLPNRVGLRGANGRGTVIKPHSSFADLYMFHAVNGTSSMFGSYLSDMYIDARGKNMTAVVWSQAWQETCGMYKVVVQFDGTTNYGVYMSNGYGGAALCHFDQCEIFANSTFATAAGILVDQISVVGGFVFNVSNTTIAGSVTNILPSGIRMVNDSLSVSAYHGEYVTNMISMSGVGGLYANTVNGSYNGITNVVKLEVGFTGKLSLNNIVPNGATNAVNDAATSRNIVASETGIVSNYNYPEIAFSSVVSAQILNVTGNSTEYAIVFDTEIYDYKSNYNNATGVFTAPRTGKYLICASVRIGVSPGVTTYLAKIATSNRAYPIYRGDTDNVRDATGTFTCAGSFVCDMDVNDTARVTITVIGLGVDTVDVEASETYFQAHYLMR